MKKLLISSAIAAIVSTSAFANNFQASGELTATISFVDTITVTVQDFTYTNAVGGDNINTVLNVTITGQTTSREISCSLPETIELAPDSGLGNSFSLNTTISGCSNVTLTDTLPVGANASDTYRGNITYLAGYKTADIGVDADGNTTLQYN